MNQRRQLLKALGIGTAAILSGPVAAKSHTKSSTFRYCLNTSTIMGQKLGLTKNIEIAAQAGFDGVELWIRDIETYLAEGNSVSKLRKHLSDAGLRFENAIGFANWMVDDDVKRAAGMSQMEKEMELLASLGCTRVAAPAAGVDAPLDLTEAGNRYGALLELGRKTGVMPQLEFWGAFPFFHHLGQVLHVASVANDPDARILPDIYHLFRGGSGFEGLKLVSPDAIEVFHLNDYVTSIPREKQEDKDRVFPGDGKAPIVDVLKFLSSSGGTKVLSLELFNQTYWERDALEIAKEGLKKMRDLAGKV